MHQATLRVDSERELWTRLEEKVQRVEGSVFAAMRVVYGFTVSPQQHVPRDGDSNGINLRGAALSAHLADRCFGKPRARIINDEKII